MFDILFARTFVIVGCMLVLTAITAKVNRRFESGVEMLVTTVGAFALLFTIRIFENTYPLNILLVGLFSLVVGWSIGPTIEYFGERFKLRKFLKSKGTPLKKGEKASREQLEEFRSSYSLKTYHEEWQNTITQAVIGAAVAVLATAMTVFMTDIDFGFLDGFLFIALIILIVMGLINTFFIKSKMVSLVRAYFGAVIFTLYLLFDFNQLEKRAGDESWAAAIEISINIYLDIINLFLDLLEVLAEAD